MKKLHHALLMRARGNVRFLLFIAIVLLSFVAGTYRDQIRSFALNPLGSVSLPAGDTVSARELRSLLKRKNFTLINVHTPYEGEIPQTDTFIPYDQVVGFASSLPKDKNAPIILYCKTGHMSGEALATVRKLGYTNVRHLTGGMDAWTKQGDEILDLSSLEKEVIPEEGITLPVSWGTLGKKLVDEGVIDLAKFEGAVKMTPQQRAILTEGSDEKITIDRSNSQFIVDVLWALGLAQKSIVYEQGPMGKEEKANVGNFASTGGWDLARGDAVKYLNRFDFIELTPDQQKKVGEIAQNVYRPCCGNSTWFPDCNHGMAALAAIELMVAAGIPEKDIYRYTLALNSYWFSQTYITIATSFARKGVAWKDVDAKTILGKDYSSAQGARAVSQKVGPLPWQPTPTGGSCSS